MKKFIFSLAIATALLSSSAMYAAGKNPGVAVQQAFSQQFSHVKEVAWTSLGKEGIYKASFHFNNENLDAFFTEDGDFLGTTRQIAKSQLPIVVITELDKQYTNARIITIFEYSKTDGTAYYITLSGARGGMIVKASANGELSVHKKLAQ